MKQPEAFSYVRFSDPKQLSGRSLERQTEAAAKYAAEHGLTLNKTLNLRDLGLSGFKSDHITKGALGKFFELVQAKKIAPGSLLIVEELDRFSRDNWKQSIAQFMQLMEAGITLVVLRGGNPLKLNSESSWDEVDQAFAEMKLGYRESEKKKVKTLDIQEDKRNENSKVHRAPPWLKMNFDLLSNGNKKFISYEFVSGAKETIRRLFQMRLNKGAQAITVELNKDATWMPPIKNKDNKWVPGNWRKSYVQKILSDKAVLGWYQHHKGKKPRVPVGEIDKNHYPKIFNEKEKVTIFDKVQLIIDGNRKLGKGHGGGSHTKDKANLFRLIIKCGLCGASMQFGSDGEGGHRLQCRNVVDGVTYGKARKRICRAHRVKYGPLEQIILKYLNAHLDLDLFQDESEDKARTMEELNNKMRIETALQEKLKYEIKKLIDNFNERETLPSLYATIKSQLVQKENKRLKSVQDYNEYQQLYDEQGREKKTVSQTIKAVKTIDELRTKKRSEGKLAELNEQLNKELIRLIIYIKIWPLKDVRKHTPRGYSFESKDISNISIRFKYKTLTLILKNKQWDRRVPL